MHSHQHTNRSVMTSMVSIQLASRFRYNIIVGPAKVSYTLGGTLYLGLLLDKMGLDKMALNRLCKALPTAIPVSGPPPASIITPYAISAT